MVRQMSLAYLVLLLASLPCLSTQRRPSVLFYGGVHSEYVVKPFVEMGIEVDTCGAEELTRRLESWKYNVVVAGTLSAEHRKALDEFMESGGGVLICSPASGRKTQDFTETNRWLESLL